MRRGVSKTKSKATQDNTTAQQHKKTNARQDKTKQYKTRAQTKQNMLISACFLQGKLLLLKRGVSKTKSKPTQDNTTTRQHKNTNARQGKTKQDKTRAEQKQKHVDLC